MNGYQANARAALSKGLCSNHTPELCVVLDLLEKRLDFSGQGNGAEDPCVGSSNLLNTKLKAKNRMIV